MVGTGRFSVWRAGIRPYLYDAYFCLALNFNGFIFNLFLGCSHISSGGQEQWPVWYPPNPSNDTMVSYCPLNIFLYFGHDGSTLSSCLGTDWKTCIRGRTWWWYTVSPSDCKYLVIWLITATFWLKTSFFSSKHTLVFVCEIVLAIAIWNLKFDGYPYSGNAGNPDYKPRCGVLEWLHFFRPVFVKFTVTCHQTQYVYFSKKSKCKLLKRRCQFWGVMFLYLVSVTSIYFDCVN